MSIRVVFSPEALADLVALHDCILPCAGEAVASAHVRPLLAHCEAFSTFPERGTRRDDIRAGLRLVGYRRQVTVALEVTNAEVRIVLVPGRGLDVEVVLRGEDDPAGVIW
jgi:plasmid stabilization system protein ParE